ncbi:MAG: LLM class flavin-dependent oxidoreductase [Alphaproteobacteria bacterium]|nr:LLM class flavin-dependent oxidoreductase [Alphaproteobacteria bacterium]
MTTPLPHPLHGPHPFKLGIFCANCDGGLTISTAPERWKAGWDDLAAMCRMADAAGIDFILPVARWLGFGGEADNLGWSFETFTHSAAIAALTTRIAVFVTVHVPMLHPVYAAKALATIDHISHGRAGLNIVCGWNQQEFDMFGLEVEHAERYQRGLEWYQIVAGLLAGGPPFDFQGRFYDLKGLSTKPLSLQRPRPVTMSAAYSPAGRDFAAKAADHLFTSMTELKQSQGLLASVRERAAAHGRTMGVLSFAHVVCRETRQEAEDFYHYFAEEKADHASLAYYRRQKEVNPNEVYRPLATRFNRARGGTYAGSYPGAFPMVGTPEDVAAEIIALHQGGLTGVTVSFLDYLAELPFFIARVLPVLERAGLRRPGA